MSASAKWLLLLVSLISLPASSEDAVTDERDTHTVFGTDEGRVVVAEDHRVPLIWMRIAFPIGDYTEWAQEHQLSLLWPAVVYGGIGERESTATIRPWVRAESCGVDLLFLRSETDAVVDEVRSLFDAGYDHMYVSGKALRRDLRWLDQSPSYRLESSLSQIFYQNRDPRRRALKRPPLETFSEAELWEMRNHVADRHGRLVGFAGDITPQQAEELMKDMFGEWPSEPLVPRPPELSLLPMSDAEERPAVTQVLMRSGEEVLFSWARPGLAISDSAAPAAILADEVVRRGIERRVRGDRGDTYSVNTSGLLGIEPRIYSLTTSTAPERALDHSAAVRDYLEGVARDGLSEVEVERARHRLVARSLQQTHAPYEILGEEMARLMYEDRSDQLTLLSRAREVSYEEVDAFARSFYALPELVTLRVLPREHKSLFDEP